MEYMMTYGWAILAVMVVGVAMWRLGVLDMSSSTPPTSNGFGAVKPILANCRLAQFGVPAYGNGWGCQFLNGAGQPINIVGLDMKVNGNYCEYMDMSDNIFVPSPAQMTSYGCWYPDICRINYKFWPITGWSIPQPPWWSPVTIQPGGTFTVGMDDNGDPAMPMGGVDPCSQFRPNEPYKVDISIDYEIDVGGAIVRQNSRGTISTMSE